MKRVLFASAATALMLAAATTPTFADNGLPVVDGVEDGYQAQQADLAERSGLAVFATLLLTPLYVTGGVMADTLDKLTGG